jgi:hypothetical protein
MSKIVNLKKKKQKLGMVGYACNSSMWEAEAGGPQVPSQPGLQSKTLSETTKG